MENALLCCLEAGPSDVRTATSRLRKRAGQSTGGARREADAMPLTRDFKMTVKARAERDPAFREALLTEAVELLLSGEVETGKAILRDYSNATVGFKRIANA